MKNLTKLVIFVIGACILLSPTNASKDEVCSSEPVFERKHSCPTKPSCPTTKSQCPTLNCFDCNKCNKDCTNLVQDCDSDNMVAVRQALCEMENANCNKVRGCNERPVIITIYPAKDYDVSLPEYKPQVFQARKNCCYKLEGIYDKTLTGIKNNGACVELFEGCDCNGASVKYDGTSGTATLECLSWIDCDARLAAGGIAFNDKTSSFKLC